MTPGAMIPFATRAFGGSTMDARQDGADLKGQVLYGGAQAAKEVFTEKMFNIALPFAQTYGKGGLDSVVKNGIRKAAEKLGKSDIGRAALEYQERLDNGKKLSGFQLMRIMQQNENGIVEQDKQKIQTAAESRLTQLGETGDTAQIARVITKQVAGERLTSDERSLIDGSRYGRRVANEIDPENVKAVATKDGIAPRDTFASEWTGKLDTKRIYPEVFNRLMPQAQKTGETTTQQEGEVTGAKYNPETGKLDAIVTDAEGKVETKPLQEAEPSPLQEELFDWSDSLKLKEAGPLMINAYRQEQQNVELYARSFKLAYEYGKAGVPMDYVNKSEGVSYLSDMQRTMAYEEGRKAERQAYENAGRSGGTASAATAKKPSVSLRGATVGGKTYAPVNRKTVDACQWASVKAMRAFSKVTGIDVVFYQSQANAKGEYEGANGFYKDGTLYLDINAGRDTVGMTETAVLKTAAHELTHFIQQNSRQYEELKKFVVERLVAEEGVNFEDLVTDKQRRESGLDYNEAVDEVVADACEMMLKDSTAAERLAKENRSLAQKIRDWLREWVENLKTAIEGLQAERTESKAMMQYAQELQKIWDDALVDAARNNRGAAQEVAPAEIKRQARVETSESINPDEKPLKGKRDDDKMGAVKASLKEDLEDRKARKEERGAFLRRATGEGIRIFEGDTIAYGYRPVRGESAGGNARQIQKELKDLGIDSEIFEGDILWNLNGVSGKKVSPQSVTVEKRLILINTNASVAPKNTAGHEAFHLWGNSDVRDAYVSEVEYNLNYTSEDFVRYQSVIANAYLGGDVDLSDTAQLQKLREELFAYISGDIHEGVNDDLLRPMFHDYDAVKAAWVKLCKDCVENKVQNSMREPVEDYIKKSTQNYGDVENDRNPFIIVEEVGIREQGANIGSEKSAGGMESNRENGRYFTGGENESGDGVRRIERDRHAGNDALSERGKSDPGGTLTDSDVKNQQRELRLSDRAVLLWAAEKAVSERSKRWSTEDLNRFDLLVKKLKGLDEAYAELEALKRYKNRRQANLTPAACFCKKSDVALGVHIEHAAGGDAQSGDDGQRHKAQGHERVDVAGHAQTERLVLGALQRAVDHDQRIVAHDARDGQRHLAQHLAVFHDGDAAMVLYNTVGGGGHLLLAGAHDDDVVGVVGDAGGHGAGLQAVALDIAQADVVGVLMPLDDGDLENVVLHVDVVNVAGVLGDDLPGHQTDDGVGTAVLEIVRCQLAEVEGVMGAVDQIGVDLRRGEVTKLAVIHQLAPLIDHFNIEILEIINDNEIGQIAGGDGAAVIEQEVAGGGVAGGLYGDDGVNAQRNGLFHDVVDMTLFQEVVGVLVVSAEHAAIHILAAQQGDKCLQIAGGGALADHDELAALQLGQSVIQIGALVVGVHAGGYVGVEVVAAEAGGVAVDLLVVRLGGDDLFHYLRVAVHGAHKVHHFRKTLYAGVVIEGVDGAVIQHGAGLVQRRGGHAGGQHEAHVHRQILRGLEHVLDAVGAHDVGDLVGIGDDGGGAVGEDGLGKLRRADQRAFQMDMGIQKAG